MKDVTSFAIPAKPYSLFSRAQVPALQLSSALAPQVVAQLFLRSIHVNSFRDQHPQHCPVPSIFTQPPNMSFQFGQQSSSNTPNKPLFGAASNTSGGTAPSLFEAANAGSTGTNTPAGPGLFGGGATTSTSSIFGGGASNTPASKPGGLFGGGGATTGASTSSLFGSSLSKPAGDAAKPASVFGGFGAPAGGATSSSPAPSFGFGTATCTCLA